MRAKISDGALMQFPYSDRMLRDDNPGMSLPRSLTDAHRSACGVVPVVAAEQPECTAAQIAEQDTLPMLVDGAWVLGWTVRDKTEAELAEESEAAKIAGKSECARRILAVADLVTQTNLLANHSAGLLSEADAAIYVAGVQWIRDMQAAWPALVEAGADLSDDANWPAVPEGAIELAERY